MLKIKGLTFIFIISFAITSCETEDILLAEGTPEIISAPIINSERILRNRFTDPNIPDYLVKGYIKTFNSTLKIEPGVLIYFEKDAALEVDANSTLISIGKEENPIILTGEAPIPGYWNGVFIFSDKGNQLEYTSISYAGGKNKLPSYISTGNSGANLTLQPIHSPINNVAAKLKIVKCSIENSAGYGVYLGDNGVLTSAQFNFFRDNKAAAVSANVNNASALAKTNEFNLNNGYNGIYLRIQLVDIQPIKIEALENGTGYLVDKSLFMYNLEVKPGVVFQCTRDATIVLGENVTVKGTPEQPIIFEGLESSSGYWRGINIMGYQLTMEHCQIKSAGSECCAPLIGSVIIEAYAKIFTIKNTLIAEGKGCGLLISNYVNASYENIIFLNIEGEDVCLF